MRSQVLSKYQSVWKSSLYLCSLYTDGIIHVCTVGKGALSDTKYFKWVVSSKASFELHPFINIFADLTVIHKIRITWVPNPTKINTQLALPQEYPVVQPDLLGLEITKGELRRLTGFDPDDVFRPSIIKDKEKRWGFFLNEILVALALTPIIVGFIYAFIILPTIGSSILIGISLLTIVPITVLFGRWLWRRKTCPQALTILLDEVDKYHGVIQAIDINDQLATSGNQTNINDRDNIIAALQLIREDLVRAMKTERILRDNKKLLANNQELFVNNLANLQALQVSSQASEYAQLLNESLQIAVEVQAEIRKLHSSS